MEKNALVFTGKEIQKSFTRLEQELVEHRGQKPRENHCVHLLGSQSQVKPGLGKHEQYTRCENGLAFCEKTGFVLGLMEKQVDVEK